MTDRWTDRLSEYLDGELSLGERVALESHLQTCTQCSEILDDLRRIVRRARTLDERPPSRDLWPGIAARIGLAAGQTGTPVDLASRRERKRWSFSLPELAAASVALMALSGGTVWLLQQPGGARPANVEAPIAAGETTPAMMVAAAKPTPTQSYAAAVADLERVLAAGRGQLDSTTILVIEQNLAAIDRAIVQAQRALEADPANLYLNTHLAETMRRKLDLLRRAAALASVS